MTEETREHRIRLVCFHCGDGHAIVAPHQPQFGFELAGWALQVGMVGYHDARHRRTLLFCNAEHARAELTKQGTFRLRAKGRATKGATP